MKRNVLFASFGLLVLAALIGRFVTVRPAHPTQKLPPAELMRKVRSKVLGRGEKTQDILRVGIRSAKGGMPRSSEKRRPPGCQDGLGGNLDGTNASRSWPM